MIRNSMSDAARRLRERRETVGLSAAQVAQRLGVDPARYRYWEKVFGPLPMRQYGEALGRILGVGIQWLAAGEGEAPAPDMIDRDALGARAAMRRRAIKMGKARMAEAIGVSVMTLGKWEESLPASHKGSRENAWEDALQTPRGWLRDASLAEPETSSASHSPFNIATANPASVSDEIRAVGAWLARASERSRTARFEDLSELEQRRAFMFAERYGVSGSGNAILQAIGDRFGLTRERVRQVVDVMTARARGAAFDLPHLSRLKEAAAGSAEMPVADFETTHRQLLGPSLSLADADCFAREILGFPVASVTERSLWQAGNALQPMLAGSGGTGIAVAVRDASRKMIRSCGAAHVMFVTGLASAALNAAVSVQEVRKTLPAIEGMEWLTSDEDWYWFGMDTANNRVMDVARKVLAVSGRRIDIEELHQAVCRSRRVLYEDDKSSPPAIETPKHVLREILARVPWLSVVQFDDFVLAQPLEPREVLNSSELAVFETIVRNGGAVARQTLNKKFVLSGVFSGPNLQIILSNSPIIRPLGFGVYGLRGVNVSEKAFAEALALVGGANSHPYGLDAAGWCEFEIEMTEFKIQRGVIDFPAGVVKAIPAGEYLARGLASGTFRVGDAPSAPGRVTRLITLLRKAGIAPGDVLRVRVHPKTMQVEISMASGQP